MTSVRPDKTGPEKADSWPGKSYESIVCPLVGPHFSSGSELTSADVSSAMTEMCHLKTNRFIISGSLSVRPSVLSDRTGPDRTTYFLSVRPSGPDRILGLAHLQADSWRDACTETHDRSFGPPMICPSIRPSALSDWTGPDHLVCPSAHPPGCILAFCLSYTVAQG